MLVLSESWTLVSPGDLRSLVRMAQEAEASRFDGVMVSEHVILGTGADADGLMENPREYALTGNQDPSNPWPHSLLLLESIPRQLQQGFRTFCLKLSQFTDGLLDVGAVCPEAVRRTAQLAA